MILPQPAGAVVERKPATRHLLFYYTIYTGKKNREFLHELQKFPAKYGQPGVASRCDVRPVKGKPVSLSRSQFDLKESRGLRFREINGQNSVCK